MQSRKFDSNAIALMREAFVAACKELEQDGKSEVRRDVILRRIIAAARIGERDPGRLLAAAFVVLPGERRYF